MRESIRRQREFAADASHELRTPLTVIRGNLRTLAAGSTHTPAQEEALGDIETEVTRMGSLVEQLLLLARSDSDALELELGNADLAEEATDALEGFAPVALGKGVRLELDVEPAPLRGDGFRLRQLVSILVDNAVRHAPPQGQVRVTVRKAGGRAMLSVEDNGPGIRPDDLPRVFDRFWRAADAPVGGSGLGLAIAAWIVERHGGRIRVENRQAGGARFIAELPAG
jgi:signal transduction histidine kinase